MARTAFVEQSGTITPNHAAKWITNGVIGDGGAISSINSVLVTGLVVSQATRNLAVIATIPSNVTAIQTYGYAAVGDGGGALYTKTVSLTLGGFQSGDGAFWELVSTPFNVKMFGAKGDGVTDDSAAILAAVNAAAHASVATASVHFPAGIYIITSSACLTPTTAVSEGIKFSGDGWFTSILRFGTLSGSTWFYDNGAANPRMQFATFTDLAFEGTGTTINAYTDIPTNANGFRLTSDGNEQGFKFARCRFSYLNIAFDMEGTNTASEIKFSQCKISHIRTAVYVLNNAQSLNHEFIACDIEVIFGDVFRIDSSGGGAIKMYGGSIIMFDGATYTFFLNFSSQGGGTIGQSPYVFSGLRIELHGNTTNLAVLANFQEDDIYFENTLFEDQGTLNKPYWCIVQGYTTMHFRGCSFYEQSTAVMNFSAGQTSGALGQNGTINFDNCALPPDWSDRCTVAELGHIRARDCYGNNIGQPSPAQTSWAHDFDLHWNEATPGLYTGWAASGATLRSDGSATDNQWRLKTAQIKLTVDYWPSLVESTLKLPKNAIIKGIHLRKPAAGGDATVLSFRVSNNDLTTHHLATTPNQWHFAATADVDNYFYAVGATTNERKLRLNTDVATSGQPCQGGVVIVEYY